MIEREIEIEKERGEKIKNLPGQYPNHKSG